MATLPNMSRLTLVCPTQCVGHSSAPTGALLAYPMNHECTICKDPIFGGYAPKSEAPDEARDEPPESDWTQCGPERWVMLTDADGLPRSVIVLDCGHSLHADCARDLLHHNSNAVCPTCRGPIGPQIRRELQQDAEKREVAKALAAVAAMKAREVAAREAVVREARAAWEDANKAMEVAEGQMRWGRDGASNVLFEARNVEHRTRLALTEALHGARVLRVQYGDLSESETDVWFKRAMEAAKVAAEAAVVKAMQKVKRKLGFQFRETRGNSMAVDAERKAKRAWVDADLEEAKDEERRAKKRAIGFGPPIGRRGQEDGGRSDLREAVRIASENDWEHPTYGPIENWNVFNVTDMENVFKDYSTFNANLNWDVSNVTDMQSMFEGCATFNADLSEWNVSNVTTMQAMFHGCDDFEGAGLSKWVVSEATNMQYTFYNCAGFNADLSEWNVSKVTNMHHTFHGCAAFDADLSKWNVSNVDDMQGMFEGCVVFKGSGLEEWVVSKVTDMYDVFSNCTAFNADLSKWNVSNVVVMDGMFENCAAFEGNGLEEWATKVSNVTDMQIMFHNCATFNADLSKWVVSEATDMHQMFQGCTAFNADLSKWNVDNVTNMSMMFGDCTAFNADLSKWNVSSVTDMNRMFWNCAAFNADLSEWIVSNVTNMALMFAGCVAFNGKGLEEWIVSEVTDTSRMFYDCVVFNADLSKWVVSNVTRMLQMFEGCAAFEPSHRPGVPV